MELYWMTMFIILLFIYMLPSMIASNRWSVNTWLVVFLNIFLWWTFFIWVVCLFLAVWKTKKDIKREEEIYNALTKKD